MASRLVQVIVGVFCLVLISILAGRVVFAQARDYSIQVVPKNQVKVLGKFWARRMNTNHDKTIKSNFRKCELTGRIDNFAKAGGLMDGAFRGRRYDDSDVFKIIEGASCSLAQRADSELDEYLDELIAKIAAGQEADGYLFSCRTINSSQVPKDAGKTRWSHLAHSHELYNVGHLYEAAVAHFQATGKRTLLDVATKNANLIVQVFGPGPGQRKDPPGHQEIEIGLVKLFRATGDRKYLQQAKFFLDQRGHPRDRTLYGAYSQDHQPVIRQTEAVGHAVRALYMYSAMADIAALMDDEDYSAATTRLWDDIVSRKMYLTGGVGSSRAGEAFGPAYDLPNATAYNETCAAIGLALFSHRMFRLHGDSKYIDVLERVIYNGFLSGVSLDGDQFFYPNPLACDGETKFNQGTLGRSPWFSCSCCPVNISRFVPSLTEYIYAVEGDSVFINLYVASQASLRTAVADVELVQKTAYPQDGNVEVELRLKKPSQFAVKLRIPGWAQGRPVPGGLYEYLAKPEIRFHIDVNGTDETPRIEKGYAVLDREWTDGDVINLKFPMPIRRVISRDRVTANRGRVALERGPLVYCAEAVDNAGAVGNLFLPDESTLTASFQTDLLDGLTVVSGTAKRLVARNGEGWVVEDAEFRAVPYYAWAHRKVGEMVVWIPRKREAVVVPPKPTIASTSNTTASHSWAGDTPKAMNDLIDPENSADQDVPRMTWWDHHGTKEWVQYEFSKATAVSSIEVYWFDDLGAGGCRVPASWSLSWRDGNEWRPVQAKTPYTVSKDRMNILKFDTITTQALRIDVQLQDHFSGGILEWRVHSDR